MTAVIPVPISTLPAAAALSGTELVPVVQAGVTSRTTAQDIADLGGGGGFGGSVDYTGVVTPAALPGGVTNNWAPALAGVSRINASSSADATVTGLAGGTDGRLLFVTNLTGFVLTLPPEDAGSAAANRFASNGDTLIPPNCSAAFLYVGAINRWSRVGS